MRWPGRALASAGIALLVLPALAAEDLTHLTQEYEVLVRRRDERGYEEQRTLLARIADARSDRSREVLRRLLDRHGSADSRRAALLLEALSRHGRPEDLEHAIQWVEKRRDPLLLDALARIVAAAEEPAAREHLRSTLLKRAPPPIKAQLVRGIGAGGDREAVAPLLLVLKDANLDVRVEALGALGMLGDERALAPLLVFLRDRAREADNARAVDEAAIVRAAAARALGMLGDKRALPMLHEALLDQDPRVQEAAATAASLLEDPSSVPHLLDRLKAAATTNLRVAETVARALHRVTGKAFGVAPDAWHDWWQGMKDKPWVKPPPDPAGSTVARAHYYGFPVASSRVLFVLDVSRSMGWNDRLDVAKEELKKTLESLPESTRFNLLVFSDEAETWAKGIEERTESRLRRALTFTRRQKPLNGTNTYDALRLAFADPDVDTIFFLSDGQPSVGALTDPDRILLEVRRWNRHRSVLIHCVALVQGDPPARFLGTEDEERSVRFMRDLAQENGGLLRVIR